MIFDATTTYDGVTSFGGAAVASRPWVQLDDIVFTGAPDEAGVEWFVEDLVGWDDGADVRAATAPRPGADGIWIGDAWYGPRMLDLKGTASAPSRTSALAAKESLIGTVNLLRRFGLLRVVYEDARQAMVRRVDRPLVRVIDDIVQFSIALLAPDPRKYASDLSSSTVDVGSTAVATNVGSVATRPAAAISGPVESPSIVLGDDEVTFDITLGDGETLDVDFDMRTARVGGVSVRAYLASGYRWGELAAGDTTVAFDAASGGADGMVVTWRSAWI